jgi:hypothetical protein
MTGAISERTSNRGRRSGATVGLKERLSAGRKIVHVLDAFVKSALKDDPSLLRNWNLVKRVPRPTGRAASAAASPSVAPTPAKPSSPTVAPAPAPAQAPAAT